MDSLSGNQTCNIQSGVFSFYGPLTPQDLSRDVIAGFGELNIPLLESLSAQVALPQHRDGGPRHAPAILEPDVDARDQSDRPPAIAQLGLPSQAFLKGARAGRSQIPGVIMDRRQRHGRRSRASLMIRTVSDHSPSVSVSATSNQRASAASLPGRSTGLMASAVKSIRV